MRQVIFGLFLVLALVFPLFFRNDSVGAAVGEAGGFELESEVKYVLPFPGILPDHPLYKLKAFRDRILEFLIRDPERKVDFYLLMADKRLNMGIMLAQKANLQLAESTVSKGEKYFVKGVDLLEKQKKVNNAAVDKYIKSAKKREEVIKSLQKLSPENMKKGYNNSLALTLSNQERLEQIRK